MITEFHAEIVRKGLPPDVAMSLAEKMAAASGCVGDGECTKK